ncbi:MAG: hypothetical protein NTX73_14330 [Rhodobacterales bacterium]|nr:hypothetical protein [Rhodobacterales bacterium]
MKRLSLILIGLPAPASAHSAFGDLGPFYQGLLHPVADPAQGLLVAAGAIALARQPISVVRKAYPTFVLAAFLTLLIGTWLVMPQPGVALIALSSLVISLGALIPLRTPVMIVYGVAIAQGVLTALPLLGSERAGRDLGLMLFGGTLGIAIFTLVVWSAAEWADRRIFHVASAVLAAWIAAISLMTAILPS